MDRSTPGLPITNSRSLFKLMSVESVMSSSHLILCLPFSSCPQSLPESGSFPMGQLFASGGKSIGVSASTSGLPVNISFRMDWLDLLAVQGTLKSLLQHQNSKASILQRSAFITVQLSHPDMTTGKTIALTRRTFVGKVTSLLFNMLSRLVITFLTRSKHLLISWLQSPSAVILEPKKIKSDIVSFYNCLKFELPVGLVNKKYCDNPGFWREVKLEIQIRVPLCGYWFWRCWDRMRWSGFHSKMVRTEPWGGSNGTIRGNRAAESSGYLIGECYKKAISLEEWIIWQPGWSGPK